MQTKWPEQPSSVPHQTDDPQLSVESAPPGKIPYLPPNPTSVTEPPSTDTISEPKFGGNEVLIPNEKDEVERSNSGRLLRKRNGEPRRATQSRETASESQSLLAPAHLSPGTAVTSASLITPPAAGTSQLFTDMNSGQSQLFAPVSGSQQTNQSSERDQAFATPPRPRPLETFYTDEPDDLKSVTSQRRSMHIRQSPIIGRTRNKPSIPRIQIPPPEDGNEANTPSGNSPPSKRRKPPSPLRGSQPAGSFHTWMPARNIVLERMESPLFRGKLQRFDYGLPDTTSHDYAQGLGQQNLMGTFSAPDPFVPEDQYSNTVGRRNSRVQEWEGHEAESMHISPRARVTMHQIADDRNESFARSPYRTHTAGHEISEPLQHPTHYSSFGTSSSSTTQFPASSQPEGAFHAFAADIQREEEKPSPNPTGDFPQMSEVSHYDLPNSPLTPAANPFMAIHEEPAKNLQDNSGFQTEAPAFELGTRAATGAGVRSRSASRAVSEAHSEASTHSIGNSTSQERWEHISEKQSGMTVTHMTPLPTRLSMRLSGDTATLRGSVPSSLLGTPESHGGPGISDLVDQIDSTIHNISAKAAAEPSNDSQQQLAVRTDSALVQLLTNLRSELVSSHQELVAVHRGHSRLQNDLISMNAELQQSRSSLSALATDNLSLYAKLEEKNVLLQEKSEYIAHLMRKAGLLIQEREQRAFELAKDATQELKVRLQEETKARADLTNRLLELQATTHNLNAKLQVLEDRASRMRAGKAEGEGASTLDTASPTLATPLPEEEPPTKPTTAPAALFQAHPTESTSSDSSPRNTVAESYFERPELVPQTSDPLNATRGLDNTSAGPPRGPHLNQPSIFRPVGPPPPHGESVASRSGSPSGLRNRFAGPPKAEGAPTTSGEATKPPEHVAGREVASEPIKARTQTQRTSTCSLGTVSLITMVLAAVASALFQAGHIEFLQPYVDVSVQELRSAGVYQYVEQARTTLSSTGHFITGQLYGMEGSAEDVDDDVKSETHDPFVESTPGFSEEPSLVENYSPVDHKEVVKSHAKELEHKNIQANVFVDPKVVGDRHDSENRAIDVTSKTSTNSPASSQSAEFSSDGKETLHSNEAATLQNQKEFHKAKEEPEAVNNPATLSPPSPLVKSAVETSDTQESDPAFEHSGEQDEGDHSSDNSYESASEEHNSHEVQESGDPQTVESEEGRSDLAVKTALNHEVDGASDKPLVVEAIVEDHSIPTAPHTDTLAVKPIVDEKLLHEAVGEESVDSSYVSSSEESLPKDILSSNPFDEHKVHGRIPPWQTAAPTAESTVTSAISEEEETANAPAKEEKVPVTDSSAHTDEQQEETKEKSTKGESGSFIRNFFGFGAPSTDEPEKNAAEGDKLEEENSYKAGSNAKGPTEGPKGSEGSDDTHSHPTAHPDVSEGKSEVSPERLTAENVLPEGSTSNSPTVKQESGLGQFPTLSEKSSPGVDSDVEMTVPSSPEEVKKGSTEDTLEDANSYQTPSTYGSGVKEREISIVGEDTESESSYPGSADSSHVGDKGDGSTVSSAHEENRDTSLESTAEPPESRIPTEDLLDSLGEVSKVDGNEETLLDSSVRQSEAGKDTESNIIGSDMEAENAGIEYHSEESVANGGSEQSASTSVDDSDLTSNIAEEESLTRGETLSKDDDEEDSTEGEEEDENVIVEDDVQFSVEDSESATMNEDEGEEDEEDLRTHSEEL